MVMKTVSIAALKAQLSKHLRTVRAGEELAVTDRGRPIALLVPVPTPVTPASRLAFAAPTHRGKLHDLKLPAVRLARPVDPVELLVEERSKGRR